MPRRAARRARLDARPVHDVTTRTVVDPRALAETLLPGRADGTDPTPCREPLHAPPGPDDASALPRISLVRNDADTEAAASLRGSELTLRAVLGRGGMGEVWLAEQRSLPTSR
jgi:hypothetical protein